MYTRIRKAREDAGYTRERFAELLDVSVSYMAEVERGRTGVSVKMLVKICDVLGLSADYVLFGEQRGEDDLRAQRIGRIDSRYLPLLDGIITQLLALNNVVDRRAPHTKRDGGRRLFLCYRWYSNSRSYMLTMSPS